MPVTTGGASGGPKSHRNRPRSWITSAGLAARSTNSGGLAARIVAARASMPSGPAACPSASKNAQSSAKSSRMAAIRRTGSRSPKTAYAFLSMRPPSVSLILAPPPGRREHGWRRSPLLDRLVGERPVEVDRQVRAVAERLVARVSAPAERHLVRVTDLPAVDVAERHWAGHEVRPVLAWSDRDVGHGWSFLPRRSGLPGRTGVVAAACR